MNQTNSDDITLYLNVEPRFGKLTADKFWGYVNAVKMAIPGTDARFSPRKIATLDEISSNLGREPSVALFKEGQETEVARITPSLSDRGLVKIIVYGNQQTVDNVTETVVGHGFLTATRLRQVVINLDYEQNKHPQSYSEISKQGH